MNTNKAGLPQKVVFGGGRIGYLDALKCLGIILMIEGHVRALVMETKPYDTLSGMIIYSFNMPIFFFVSGLLAYKSCLTNKETIMKMWQKFVFLVIPAIIFKCYFDLMAHKSPFDLLQKGFGQYWFTFTLFECFFLYYLSIILIKKESVRHFVLIVIAIIGLVFLSILQKFGLAILDMNHLTKYFLYFMIGILSMKYRIQYQSIVKNEYIRAFTSLTFFALLFLLSYNFWPKPAFHFMRDIVLRLLGTYVIISFFACHATWFMKNNKVISLIEKIGQRSLAIYLLHYFFVPHRLPLPQWIMDIDRITIPIFSSLITIVILAVSMLFISLLMNSKIVAKYGLGQK